MLMKSGLAIMNKIFQQLSLLMVLIVLTVFPGQVFAVTCSIVSTSTVAFGTYDVFNATPNDTTGTITMICDTAETPVAIKLDKGTCAPDILNRQMCSVASGTKTINYNLYRSAADRNAGTPVWGDGTQGSVNNVSIGTSNTDITIYGRIPAGEDAWVASDYKSTIIATANW